MPIQHDWSSPASRCVRLLLLKYFFNFLIDIVDKIGKICCKVVQLLQVLYLSLYNIVAPKEQREMRGLCSSKVKLFLEPHKE